jgi:hypothetical protein
MRRWRFGAVAAVAACLCAGASDATAQPGPFLRAHRLEVNVGGLWLGGVDFGTADATLTRNQTPEAPYVLFTTASTLAAAPAAEARVGYHLTRMVAVEGAFVYARPRLETAVSADAEGAPGITATETLSQFLVDVSAVVHLPIHMGRAVPFVLGGAGYLRELHEANALAETGHTFHAGGGVKIPLLVRRGFVRSLGLRLDGRAYFRSGGADLDQGRPIRSTAAGGASLLVEFGPG